MAAPRLIDDQIDGQMVVVEGHLRQPLDRPHQSPGHFATGRIIGVYHPRMRVAAFAPQRQFAGSFFIEHSAYRQQFAHDLGSFRDHRFGDRPIAEPVSG